jgi:hypothetical protein
MRGKKKPSQKKIVVIRNMPEFHTLYGTDMPVFGKSHRNERGRTLESLRGFRTKKGHFIDRAWGAAGAAICGATVLFSEDPIVMNGDRPDMAACCRNRLQRIRRKLRRKSNLNPS